MHKVMRQVQGLKKQLQAICRKADKARIISHPDADIFSYADAYADILSYADADVDADAPRLMPLFSSSSS